MEAALCEGDVAMGAVQAEAMSAATSGLRLIEGAVARVDRGPRGAAGLRGRRHRSGGRRGVLHRRCWGGRRGERGGGGGGGGAEGRTRMGAVAAAATATPARSAPATAAASTPSAATAANAAAAVAAAAAASSSSSSAAAAAARRSHALTRDVAVRGLTEPFEVGQQRREASLVGGGRLIERDEEELGNLGLDREEDMFLVAEKVDDGVVCTEGWKGRIKGGPCVACVAGIMPESVAERLALMAPGE